MCARAGFGALVDQIGIVDPAASGSGCDGVVGSHHRSMGRCPGSRCVMTGLLRLSRFGILDR